MDRYDMGEWLGLAGLTVFAAILWAPAAVLVGSLCLLVEVNLRSAGRAPVRGARPLARAGVAVRAARVAWSRGDAAA